MCVCVCVCVYVCVCVVWYACERETKREKEIWRELGRERGN